MPDNSEHIVKSYEQELKRLRAMVAEMGGAVERQVALACEAVLHHDRAAAGGAMEADPGVDAMEHDIEQYVIRLLALRQPVAQDLRLIIATLKTTGDLERIGDYAANVAKRSLVVEQFNLRYAASGLGQMAALVQGNLKRVIDAAGNGDAAEAMEVWRSDEAIDAIYNALFRELITYMMEDPRNISPCTHLLFIAKNLERIGDHATNVAETIYYAVEGTPLAGKRPKADMSAYSIVRPADA